MKLCGNIIGMDKDPFFPFSTCELPNTNAFVKAACVSFHQRLDMYNTILHAIHSTNMDSKILDIYIPTLRTFSDILTYTACKWLLTSTYYP